MFGSSRRRAASNASARSQNQPASASASLAATKAFIRDRESTGALSSAAAAAALRTHATTPTPVGDTVTKRMVRRGSTSSHGSGSQQAQGLRRHSSSGSMTERSFRAPSPNRGSPAPDHHDAPPVPQVPREVPGVGVVHRRASSLEPPQRGGSNTGRGRGVSLDRGAPATAGRGQRVMSLQQVPENDQDPASRSVNFSRPISPPQTNSPKPARGGHSGWFAAPVVNHDVAFRGSPQRPKTAVGASQYDLQNAQYAVQAAANKPTSSKRIQTGVEGARLSSGSMRAKPSGTMISHTPSGPVDPKSPNAVYDPSTRKFVHKQVAMERFRELSDQHDEHEQPTHQYVAPQPAPARPQSAHQPRVTQRAPVRFEEPRARTPSPPRRQYQPEKQRHVPEEVPVPAPAPLQFESVEQTEYAEDRPPSPPPVRSGPVLERQKSEDVAEADIKPAPTTQASKLRVAPPEQSRNVPASTDSPRFANNQDSPYPHLGPTQVLSPSDAQIGKGRGSIREDRPHSLSPPRVAHFATGVIEESDGVRHQPPPRSVSPAKSALKASPSASRRNSSPITSNGRIVSNGSAPSETSETASDQGLKKKKKNVRVSFDEAPVIAGTSAYGDSERPSSPTGLSQSRWSTPSEVQHVDDVMTPRSVLPSFSSIRDSNRRTRESEVPEKVTETVSSSLTTSAASIREPLEASSDHAVGGILARDHAAKTSAHPTFADPLPPEVTSVEGSGYVSDSSEASAPDSSVSQQKEDANVRQPPPEPKMLTTPVESTPQQPPAPPTAAPEPPPELPVIAVQPATPNLTEEVPQPKTPRPFVPGGWDDDEDTEPEVEKQPVKQPHRVSFNDARPQVGLSTLQAEDESSSEDNSSVYSDAYEELTDNEGGFASLDAIVESPIVPSNSGLLRSKYAEPNDSKKETPQASNDSWDASRQHWSGLISAHKLQQEQGTTSRAPPPALAPSPILEEREFSLQETPTPAPAPAPTAVVAPKVKQTPSPVSTAPVSTTGRAPAQPRKSAMRKTTPVPQTSAPQQPQLKKTMRGGPAPSPQAQPAPETHMRRSMRDGPSGPQGRSTMRTSMRSEEPRQSPRQSSETSRAASGLAASRHSMPPLETKPPKGALQKRNIPSATPAPRARPQSAIAKPMVIPPTYDSDSDASASSFRRERRRPSRGDGQYTMRSSMRSGPTPTMREAPPMRPSSPPAARPPPAALRKSLRPSSPTPEPPPAATKSSRFSIRSLSPRGFGRAKVPAGDIPPLPTQTASPKTLRAPAKAPGKQAQPKKVTPTPKPRFQSRFADSSEDEDDRPRRFQSRFADSDDDDSDFELPQGLTPVRGIPRKAGAEDGDSTDLEEEVSDEERPATAKAASKDIEKSDQLTNGNTNGQGASLAAGSLRNKNQLPSFESGKKAKGKRGFFGLGKKKTPTDTPTEFSSSPLQDRKNDIPLPPGHKDRPESLVQDQEQEQEQTANRPLSAIDENKATEAPVRPMSPTLRSPKLQRRNTPQMSRSTSDSWPLPLPPTIGEEPRPQSSDGLPNRRLSLRPTLGKRNTTGASEARSTIDTSTGKTVSFGRTGKKKKFQGLRRVFGLND